MWRKVFDERTEKTRPDVRRPLDVPDLELEDDAETKIQRPSVRWPERPKFVRERSRASRTDNIGLSRPIVAPSRSVAPLWLRMLLLAVVVAAALCLTPLRLHRRLYFVLNSFRSRSSAATMSEPQPARAPLKVVVGTPPVASASRPMVENKKGVDVSSLPLVAPAPSRSRPRPAARPAARPPRPAPPPPPAGPSSTRPEIEENAYDEAPRGSRRSTK
jgi:hypothetical protein